MKWSLRPQNRIAPRLSGLVLLALLGCSFDAGRLRASAPRDADSPIDSRLVADEGPLDLVADRPLVPEDAILALDSSAPDTPFWPEAGETAYLALDAESNDASAPDATADLPSASEDAMPSIDGPFDTPTGTGGVDATGGDTGTGGISSTGGTGGAAGSGGSPDTGGTSSQGGTVGAGGATALDAPTDAGDVPNAITEYLLPTAISQPWVLTVGPDNNLWIVERAANKIARFIIADTSFKEFPVAGGGGSIEAIALGADGNLWFTEYGNDRIGRMTVDGSINEFGIQGTGPDGLVAGPDGNLWFTEMNSNSIGRMTTGGVSTHYSVPITNSQPSRLAVGSDGNIWFALYGASRIGHLAPTLPTPGPVGSYLTNSLNSLPSGIAAGNDGNLWFYEVGPNRIGRIIPSSGVVSEYNIPTANSAGVRGNITAGPDNNVWFTEFAASKIGRITPSGSITEFPVPTKNSSPYGIVAGPDGKLWFAESDSNQIASIAP